MNKTALFRTTKASAAGLSDDERRELLSLALPVDSVLRSIHAAANPPTVEYAQYGRDEYGYRNWDNPVLVQATYTIGDDLAVTLGEPSPVLATTVYQKISEFSLTESGKPFERGGMMVYPMARLFAIGDYSDKGFPKPVTADDLATLVSLFVRGDSPVNIEHESLIAGTDSSTAKLLSGKMGHVSRVWIDDAKEWVKGEVEIPLWLYAEIEAGAIPSKLSVEVFPDTMKLAGVALTGNPRVPNAALLSAYQKTPKGNEEMPELTEAAEKSIVDKVVAAVTGLFHKEPAKEPETKPTGADVATMSAQIAALEAERAKDRTERIKEQATFFVDSIIGKKAMPAERQSLIEQYQSAAENDARQPSVLVTFSTADGQKTGSHLELFKAGIDVRPSMAYLMQNGGSSVEVLPSGVARMSEEDKEKAFQERRAAYLSNTSLGQTVLATTGKDAK